MIPLSLYIHFPWCVKKCPYCDFNSHALGDSLPEQEYIDALVLNLKQTLPATSDRPIISIFMGGGTPSLFSAQALEKLLSAIDNHCQLSPNIEITLEANPGTVEQQRFQDYKKIGINRLSIGIQSFNDKHLKILGRIHDGNSAIKAIDSAREAGFTNFNLDLMFGLPEQTLEEGLADINMAILQQPTHISWYELTLEPNTFFWHHPPTLPQDDDIITLQEQGQVLLADSGFMQYEVSAYSKNRPCQHNLNYWSFGDYAAIGAGSHAKMTDMQTQKISRLHHYRHPKQYMDTTQGFVQADQQIDADQLAFEFMLNALRLKDGVPTKIFTERTGLSLDVIRPQLLQAQQKGLMIPFEERICTTPLGFRFLNDVIEIFLPKEVA
ncbi:MAG: YggW family oxidoreductase [Gammaproteobacteria bacterium 39-13]|nr:radical SAM family heme chaperone HemW [Gammaproteobacteria bacterium]OJV90519.1 MAG: YggW family oxidoreductase [Gammaproteobacteria bacterium 39-13]